MELGRIGIWTGNLDAQPIGAVPDIVGEIEALDYDALWLPEVAGRDPFVNAALILRATERLVIATGIATIYSRDPIAMSSVHKTLTDAFPGRFLLGLGVSHQPAVEGIRKHEYGPPLTAMRQYLDGMDAAPYFAGRAGGGARPRARRARPEDARPRGRTRHRRAPVLRPGRAHRDRARRHGPERVAHARADGRARVGSGPSPGDRPRRDVHLPHVAELREQPAPPRLDGRGLRRRRHAIGWSMPSSCGATRCRSARGSTSTSPRAPTTSASRC